MGDLQLSGGVLCLKTEPDSALNGGALGCRVHRELHTLKRGAVEWGNGPAHNKECTVQRDMGGACGCAPETARENMDSCPTPAAPTSAQTNPISRGMALIENMELPIDVRSRDLGMKGECRERVSTHSSLQTAASRQKVWGIWE